MSRCSRIQEVLLPYLDGVLIGEAKSRGGEHVRQCADCMKRLESLRETGELLAAAGRARRSEKYWQQFQDRLRHGLESGGGTVPETFEALRIHWRSYRRAWSVAGAAVLALLIITVGVTVQSRKDTAGGNVRHGPQAVPVVSKADTKLVCIHKEVWARVRDEGVMPINVRLPFRISREEFLEYEVWADTLGHVTVEIVRPREEVTLVGLQTY